MQSPAPEHLLATASVLDVKAAPSCEAVVRHHLHFDSQATQLAWMVPKTLVPTAGLTEALTAEMATSLVQGTPSLQVVFLMGSCPAVVGEPPAHVPDTDDHWAAVLVIHGSQGCLPAPRT